jgi:uncharacterized protein (DUF885 family)
MKKFLMITGIIFLSLFLIVAVLLANIIWFKPFSIRIFYEKVSMELLMDQPELISQLGLPIRYFNNKWDDVSISKQEKRNKRNKKNLLTLKKYNYNKLTGKEKLSYDVLDWQLTDMMGRIPWQYYNYPVTQLFGAQVDMPTFMDNNHRVVDERDARDYISRLSKFPVKFNQVFEGIEKREELGIIPPKFVIEKVLTGMIKFLEDDVEKNILWHSFRDKLKKSKIDTAKHDKFLADAKEEIQNSVYPSYRSLMGYLENLYQKATTDDGVWKFPNGDAYYQYVLQNNTHTNMSAEEIHQLGLNEVARIQDEMKQILTELGYSPGISFRQSITPLLTDKRFYYPALEESYVQIVKDYQAYIDNIADNLGDAFHIRPKAAVEVRRVPEFKQENAYSAYYEFPSLDGSRPGVFYINLRDLSEIIKYKMATLAYHEAIPGHHFQIALQLELKGVPTFRKLNRYNVFIEGWAMYAEYLAWELGFHSDPYNNLGRLEEELFRAVRLVVDTGIHYKRWTREQAIAYMYENTGSPKSDVEAEIERYIVDPGQACSYKAGMIQILALRQKAMDALGDQFKLADFHDVILGNATIPMPILEKEVERYIERKLQVSL